MQRDPGLPVERPTDVEARWFPSDATLPLAAALVLAGCGGGGDAASAADASPATPATGPATIAAPAAAHAPTEAEAARFLIQASMGADRIQIARVTALGYAGWLDEQLAWPATTTRWDALLAGGFGGAAHKNGEAGFDGVVWQKLLASPDTLRQRVTLALSEIFVVGIGGLTGGWAQFSAAAYLDLLEANAFGNHRTLLQQISLSAPMGQYLTYRGSAKANTRSGALPDENYARELLQLFTIGLVRLEADATPTLTGGSATPTYGQADITGLARVFTGWDHDFAGQPAATATATPDYLRKPMAQVASRYETGAKTFLGTTIAAGIDAPTALTQALDAIWAHPNVAPFFGRQLIQRLVTSNPSAAYVRRIARVFDDNGSGVRGDLKAVVRALLLDGDARDPAIARSASFGKLREPILRFAAWARATRVASASGAWAIGNTSDPGTRLAQSPLRSSSVFNFFRPGYVPPSTAFDAGAMVAPEFQLANESSVVGYLNYMQRVVAGQGIGDVVPDHAALLAIADDATALVAELGLLLAASRLAPATSTALAAAVQTMPAGTDAARLNRVRAALLLVLAAPEFLVQK